MRRLPQQLLEHPCGGAARIAASLVRKRVPALATATTRFGRSLVEVDLRTSLGLRLYRYPSWMEADLQVVRDSLGPGDVFVDGGANIGLFTLVAAERVGPSGRVIAVEPGPVRRCLERNLDLNKYRWVDVHAVALGNVVERRAFTYFDGEGSGLSSFAPSQSGGQVVQVDVRRLDDLVPAELLDRVKLVKLDLEGAEVEALGGAKNLLERTTADFLVEIEASHLARQGATAEQLCQFFDEFDQRSFAGSPNRLFMRRRPGRAGPG